MTNQLFYEAISAESGSNEGYLSDVESIIGLSRKTNVDTNILLAYKMWGTISFQAVFSVYLAPTNQYYATDSIAFGDIDQQYIRDVSELRWINLESGTKLWAAETTAVRFGIDELNSYSFTTSYRGVFDSLSSFIRLPASISEYFIDKVTENTNSYKQNGWVTVSCEDENLPSIFFLVGGYWIEASPVDYAIDISAAQDKSICGLAISANDDDEIAFGLPILRGYYTIFDVENDNLAIAPNDISSKQGLEDAYVPASYFIVPIPWQT